MISKRDKPIKKQKEFVILFGLSEFVCAIPYEIHIKYIMHIKHLIHIKHLGCGR